MKAFITISHDASTQKKSNQNVISSNWQYIPLKGTALVCTGHCDFYEWKPELWKLRSLENRYGDCSGAFPLRKATLMMSHGFINFIMIALHYSFPPMSCMWLGPHFCNEGIRTCVPLEKLGTPLSDYLSIDWDENNNVNVESICTRQVHWSISSTK